MAKKSLINKANAVVVVTPYTVTYDGTAHTATVTSITGVNGETGTAVGSVTLNTKDADDLAAFEKRRFRRDEAPSIGSVRGRLARVDLRAAALHRQHRVLGRRRLGRILCVRRPGRQQANHGDTGS